LEQKSRQAVRLRLFRMQLAYYWGKKAQKSLLIR
jgi:hypothetical protein